MTPEARASLSEQLLSNPMWDILFDELEADAIEQMIAATDHETRERGAMRVTAVRTLRSDCERNLRNNQARKAAPA